MADKPPLSERILDATEEVLRRHGAEKSNVVDVARVLGMSHANIYRHFASKKALLDGVAVRWMRKVSDPLEVIALDQTRPAAARLMAWFDALREAKRRKVLDDPELFRVYHTVAEAAREVVSEHIAVLLGQVERIIADGVAGGEFDAGLDPRIAAQAFLHATVQFHHPAMVAGEHRPTDAEAHVVLRLLLAGLRVGPVPV